MWGDLLKHQESPEMTFDTTRLYKTRFQEVTFLKMMFTKLWLGSTICCVIENLGLTQFESTSNIIMVGIENSSFGYDLTI